MLTELRKRLDEHSENFHKAGKKKKELVYFGTEEYAN